MQLQASPGALAAGPGGTTEGGEGPRLRGDLAVWLVIGIELLSFGLLFVAFAFARLREPELFATLQATLDLHAGALNTVLLISGSAFVARAVHALRGQRPAAAQRGLLAALVCAAGFMALKGSEMAGRFAAGADLDANTFWMFYILLSGFHFVHVVAATVFLAIVLVGLRRGAWPAQRVHVAETAGAFWHMVDLLWIVLFPLLYVTR